MGSLAMCRGSVGLAANPMSVTAAVLSELQQFESRNVTYVDPTGAWPIVWERARGHHVWDAEGRRFVDFTAAFGVAAAGHANPRVVRAGRRQMGQLLHAMGDVHPHPLKSRLARRLSEMTFGRWEAGHVGKVIFGNSGFEAVEAALKTARLATGKSGLIAFEGAYHGLGYGALNATHREHFRAPFRSQLREFAQFVPYPQPFEGSTSGPAVDVAADLDRIECALRQAFRTGEVGAILVEPVQARGGIRIPPPEFLRLLRTLAHEHGALLILDEIYTGFGRTGKWFACEWSEVVPDLICLGKALTGGFPLSACVGRASVMDAAWPLSDGEAIHTSTFLGHPVGCAMALAQLEELIQQALPAQAEKLGRELLCRLRELPTNSGSLRLRVRGIGLMAGIELRTARDRPGTSASVAAVKSLLQRRFLVLPEGEHSEVIGLTPPLTIPPRELRRVVQALGEILIERGRAQLEVDE